MKSLSLKVTSMEESQTLAFSARANAMKRQGIDVCALTAGEPDFSTPTYIKDAAIAAIRDNFTHYTNNAGIPELLKAVAHKFKIDNNIEFEPSQILVSSGAKHSVFNALLAICNPGDEVIVPAPYWVSYPEMVKLIDAVPVIVNSTAERGFILQADDLRKAITPKTKAMIFNSPCNPTGAVHTEAQIRAIAEVVRDTGIYVISDEIYEKIMFDGYKHFSIGSIPEIRNQVVTVNGMSKAYAMTGWRIGYMGASKEIIEGASKVQSQVTSNITSICQKAAVAALSTDTGEIPVMADEFRKRRDYMVPALRSIPGVEIVEPKGAFYLFPSFAALIGKRANGKIIGNDIDLCMHLLNDHHLGFVPGTPFGAPGHVRISYACKMADLERGIGILRKALGELA